MSDFLCGPTVPATVLRQIVGLRTCCMGAISDGPSGCTCWEPIYDRRQKLPLEKTAPVTTRRRMCEDCAFRPDSPERTGDERYSHVDELDELDHFWCHQGMRKPTAWRHPELGITIEADTDGYDPPRAMVGEQMVPFRADGTPGQRCAGFAARQRQLVVAASTEGPQEPVRRSRMRRLLGSQRVVPHARHGTHAGYVSGVVSGP